MEELLKQMEVQAKKDLAALLKNQLDLAFEVATKVAAEKLKAAIPGQVDDAIIDMVVPALSPIVKAELLKAIAELEK